MQEGQLVEWVLNQAPALAISLGIIYLGYKEVQRVNDKLISELAEVKEDLGYVMGAMGIKRQVVPEAINRGEGTQP